MISTSKYNFNIPGININELLILDEIISDENFNLKVSLCQTILVIILISQISLNTIIEPRQKQNLDSVRNYRQRFLNKNKLFIGLSAAVAIRKTMGAYSSLDSKDLKNNFIDLFNNTTGPATRSPRLQMIINNPIKLRSHRRNIMLRTSGKIQAQTIYQPSLPYPDMANLLFEFLSDITPLEDDEFIIAKNNIVDMLYPKEVSEINWLDGIKINESKGKNLTFLEHDLFGNTMSRLDVPTLPETPLPAKTKNSPWKQAVITQLENLKNE